MSRRWLASLLGLAGLVALGSPLWAPPILRRVPWFDVRRVEISGTALLAPHQVLSASGLRSGASLWGDLAAPRAALAAHPVIASVSVSRRLPGTLRIRVQEKKPIAYVESAALVPITATGEILPVDPGRARMDLPVIRARWSATDPGTRRVLLAETDRLGRADAGLLANISEIRLDEADPNVLNLSHPLAEIVIPMGGDPLRLSQLRAVLADLERRLPPEPRGLAAAPARVDLRFADQIVVRLPSSVESY